MAATQDLGSCSVRSAGSSPVIRTNLETYPRGRRELPTKQPVLLRVAWVRIPESPPSIRKNVSYPEQVAADWLSANNINFEPQYYTDFKDHKRYVDFYLPDFALYIEIDGEKWHKDSTESDLEKDLYAKNVQHIDTLRIKPKQNVIKQLSEYFNKI